MGRIAKQVAYGFGFLLAIGLIGAFLYVFQFKAAPTCEDSRRNQGETEIDCGGPCIPCELKGLEIEETLVRVIESGGERVTLLAIIQNPSERYGADVKYRFDVIGSFGGRVFQAAGVTALDPGGTRYIVEAGVPVRPEDAGEVRFVVEGVSWHTDEPHPAYKMALEDIRTVDGEDVRMLGTLQNSEPLGFRAVRITAILQTAEGEIAGASALRLTDIPAFDVRDIVIFFPPLPKEVSVDVEKTLLFIEAFET